VTAALAGPFADRHGRRRVLLLGVAWLAISIGLQALARSLEVLLALRALAGIGGGMLAGAVVATVADVFSPARRGLANGVAMSGYAVGQIGVLPAGTLLAPVWGFRGVFLLFAAILVVAFVAIALAVPRRAPPDPRAPPPRWFVTIGETLRDRGARPAMLVFATLFFGYGALMAFYPDWLVTSLDAGPDEIAALLLAAGVVGVLAAPAAGTLSDRFGRKRVVVGACLGMAVLAPLAPLAFAALVPAGVTFVALQALSAGRIAPLQALVTELAPPSRRSTLLSMTVAAGQLGAALGAWLAGVLFARSGFVAVGLLSGGAMVAAAVVLLVAVPRGEPTAREAHEPT
jgi:DHA1 family inner membrane transport protein